MTANHVPETPADGGDTMNRPKIVADAQYRRIGPLHVIVTHGVTAETPHGFASVNLQRPILCIAWSLQKVCTKAADHVWPIVQAMGEDLAAGTEES
ncbi:hypothetical protein [Bifidobacterium moukalabense]|uniref:hypothetical protein n=1 Tax=Bifidobacterium moukalabense TaxID=1333651 RepID=UPI0010F61D55|nr:hypothetical protein [Bifidobacterium moukalabense]